ncbi:hypothetical protein SAY87_010724 [Trapa incisa]|uniref:Peptidase A1 domain-containing protein n=1 Tax=Trapa incisa TaxID=236973 RepID=A0AAN7JI78_9MYRT|nr:hypothetical protein SAY87_010724 [Trapa incisa]
MIYRSGGGTMTGNKWLLLLLFIGSQARASLLPSASGGGSMELGLVRGHSWSVEGDGGPKLELTREVLRHDVNRYKMIISAKHRRESAPMTRRKAWEEDYLNGNAWMEAPMTAGRDYGIGEYVVQVKVGTPPKKFWLIADTGSDLTWMRCLYDHQKPRRGHRPGVLLPAKSSTFATIPCSSHTCKVDLMNLFSLSRCPTPSSPCAYDFRYTDGSFAKGIFAYETISVDLTSSGPKKLERMLIGCSEIIKGQTLQPVDGVLGLANSEYSFTARAAREFGGKFSYCLVDHLSHKNLSNHLTFGSRPQSRSPLLGDMQYTKLVLGRPLNPLYGVDILGISVGGTILGIPVQVWAPNSGGGTVIDSGTSLTLLAAPAYRLIFGALEASLSRYKKVDEKLSPLKYCFDSTGFNESLIPRLGIHFKDGAVFEPQVKSYVIDAAPGIKCLGLLSVSWPGVSVIGNILQQNHLWEFNLAKGKLGFAPSSCIYI